MIELLCSTLCDRRTRRARRQGSPTSACASCTIRRKIRVKANVLRAFLDEGVLESDLAGTSGYGYDDAARERYESLLARIVRRGGGARAPLDRERHACDRDRARRDRRPGTRLIAAAGRPYDTLRNAICDAPYSLLSQGVELPRDRPARRRFAGSRRASPERCGAGRARSSCSARAAMRRGLARYHVDRAHRCLRARSERRLRPCSSITATANSSKRANQRMWAPIW